MGHRTSTDCTAQNETVKRNKLGVEVTTWKIIIAYNFVITLYYFDKIR